MSEAVVDWWVLRTHADQLKLRVGTYEPLVDGVCVLVRCLPP